MSSTTNHPHFGHISTWLRLITAILAAILTGACANLVKLDEELSAAKKSIITISGTISSDSCPECRTVVVVVGEEDGRQVDFFLIIDRPGPFVVSALATSRHLFVFHDQDQQLKHQEGTPYGWYELTSTRGDSNAYRQIRVVVSKHQDGGKKPPQQLIDLLGFNSHAGNGYPFSLGEIEAADSKRFSDENAELGMWQPFTFLRQGLPGIYFLEKYSPNKTPVLFVHGINGTPQSFQPLIESLDRTKFQPWVMFYPSALGLNIHGNQLYHWLNVLRAKHRFSKLHIVAHSMGGLVVRDYLARCSQQKGCDYLRSFTSISSPFAGHAAAKNGVEYSPVIMPVWKHMSPDSVFLTKLFSTPLPEGMTRYLLFGYKNTMLFGRESSDGLITLESELRPEAQVEATVVRGYHEDHMEILRNKEVHQFINERLRADSVSVNVRQRR